MTPAERKLLIEIGRAVATRILNTRTFNDLIAAVRKVEDEKLPQDVDKR